MSRYGVKEFGYAAPFADALAADRNFSAWVLRRTKFRDLAEQAVLLNAEMLAKRGRTATTWWRSHYTESCRCLGCSGQETDLFAVYRVGCDKEEMQRFALHIEVKQPTDRFPAGKDQAEGYRFRAACWVAKPPKAVLQHHDADTMLLCARGRLDDYEPHWRKFGAVLTFEEIGEYIPASFERQQSGR